MNERPVRCTECREVSLPREWTPTCPNPACRIGLSAYWDAMKQWRLERDDYIKTQHANANARGYMYASRTVLVDMFKSRNPEPPALATGRSTTYEMWVGS